MRTGKRLDGQMNPLMPLQIVIPIEALRTLIALEGTIVCWSRTGSWMRRDRRARGIHVLQTSDLAAVQARQDARGRGQVSDHGHLAAGIVEIGEDGAVHGRQGIGRPWSVGQGMLVMRRWTAGGRQSRLNGRIWID